jgi:outer membrane protein
MKRSIKIFMVAALTLGATSVFAQKFGRIDYQTTLFLMPEMATVQADLEKENAEYREQIEGIQVEINKKVDEISKLPETTSETAKQLKQRELMDLQQRYQDFVQMAEQSMQKSQLDKVMPLKTKLDEAIKKVCKAQAIVVAFQTVPEGAFASEVIYVDDSAIDINAAVRKELGIAADAVLPAPTAQR